MYYSGINKNTILLKVIPGVYIHILYINIIKILEHTVTTVAILLWLDFLLKYINIKLS